MAGDTFLQLSTTVFFIILEFIMMLKPQPLRTRKKNISTKYLFYGYLQFNIPCVPQMTMVQPVNIPEVCVF